VAILVSLESLQNGYELHEKVLIRMGWDMATAQAEKKFNSLQQLKAKIAALITDIGEPNGNVRRGIDIRQVIERLRQLSAV
jgi:hypothetical protein